MRVRSALGRGEAAPPSSRETAETRSDSPVVVALVKGIEDLAGGGAVACCDFVCRCELGFWATTMSWRRRRRHVFGFFGSPAAAVWPRRRGQKTPGKGPPERAGPCGGGRSGSKCSPNVAAARERGRPRTARGRAEARGWEEEDVEDKEATGRGGVESGPLLIAPMGREAPGCGQAARVRAARRRGPSAGSAAAERIASWGEKKRGGDERTKALFSRHERVPLGRRRGQRETPAYCLELLGAC